MKQIILTLLLAAGFAYTLKAQTGAIAGTIYDERKEPVAGAFIQVFQKGLAKGKDITEKDGTYKIDRLPSGSDYELRISSVSYKEIHLTGVVVHKGRITYQNFSLQPNEKELKEVVVKSYRVPLLTKDAPGTTTTITGEDIARLPTRHSHDAAALSGAVYEDNSITEAVQVRGRRKPKREADIQAVYRQGNESYAKVREHDFMTVKANPLSTLSVDVDRASYSNVRRFINEGQNPPADAVRIEEMINYFHYDYPQPEEDDPIAIVTELTDCPWNEDHRLLRIGMQARTIGTRNLPPSNLVFLVDVSGSMNAHNKLPLVKSSLKMLVRKLRAKDKVSIVVYAGNAGLVLPPTPGNQKATILGALDRLEAGGSTAGGAGIQLAYRIADEHYEEGGNNRVILATDGDFNVGINGDNELEDLITRERKKGIFLTCLGYGMGNYKDSKLEILADKGNGNYAYIDNTLEAEKTLVHEFGGTLFTVAKDVKAQIEFNPSKVQSYRLVGYENRLLNEEDFRDDKKDAGDMGSGHQVTILYELVPAGTKNVNTRNTPELKYQQRAQTERSYTGELATVRFRYKQPEGSRSKEMVHGIQDRHESIDGCSDDTRFASAVALFGMLLRDSKFAREGDTRLVLDLARHSKGADEEGYRHDFIQMVKQADNSISLRD